MRRLESMGGHAGLAAFVAFPANLHLCKNNCSKTCVVIYNVVNLCINSTKKGGNLNSA